VRLLAAVLKESGMQVLAKTTGSKPVLIYPDGKETELQRSGSPSILEGKSILKLGSRLNVQALVTEMMSIRPESILTESVRVIRPHLLVITNVREDHTEQMGRSKSKIAQAIASAIPPQSTVVIPEEEIFPVFLEVASKRNSEIFRVPALSSEKDPDLQELLSRFEFQENIRLAAAAAEALGIDRSVILGGMKKSSPDFGSLQAWAAEWSTPSLKGTLVSAFAANEPESTQNILSKLNQRGIGKGMRKVAILNLRRDRGDRTLQWQRAINEAKFQEFDRFFLTGTHAHAFRRGLRPSMREKFKILKEQSPEKIMEEILSIEKDDVFLVGMGNMKDRGAHLVDHWKEIGDPYAH
jgi:poly-gamma-glutamate synthase PgsB/CapB